ncbi:MAG: apolipoprotein N-acyltransferase [Prevotellaceae bacterium]|jgi:apolipoprotein N-acyltransferase|nr:apolipoprotein N-acyltransferase [Prevotellaceae bacterium]
MKHKNIILCLLSVLLLTLPWYAPFSELMLLVAFVPLFFIEDDYSRNNKKYVIKYFALCFLLWNAFTTWWIYKATFFGAVGAVIGNSLQMIVIFWLFHWVKKHTSERVGYTMLITCWLSWEWFYFDAEISWPWLVLGNGFAKDIQLIQWYEYTGVLGGSLWVLISNTALFFILRKFLAGNFIKHQRIEVIRWLLIVLGPITMSLVIYYSYNEKENLCNVVVLQPNIDPYNDKFGGLSYQQQVDILLNMAAQNIDTKTDYVVAPETAIEGSHWEETIKNDLNVMQIKEFVKTYPKVNFVTGIMTNRLFGHNDKIPASARKYGDSFYQRYNTAMQVNNTADIGLYHKSKLVVGVEMLPYIDKLKFLSKWSINLGGTSGTLGTQDTRDVFTSADGRFNAGVAICYEAIYGEFYTEYVRNGANVMLIISNDGWWGDTPGYRQLLHYSSLRAIETRRSIARSANTGISAFINQRGQIMQQGNWWERQVLQGYINANDKITFYTRYGDITGRVAGFLFVMLLLYAIVQRIRPKVLK